IVDLAAESGDLQPDRVARFETARRHALGNLPAGLPAIVRRDVRRRVQAQARDDRVSVAVARVNRDPFTASSLTEVAELGRANGGFEQTSRAERVGNRTGTVITPIGK